MRPSREVAYIVQLRSIRTHNKCFFKHINTELIGTSHSDVNHLSFATFYQNARHAYFLRTDSIVKLIARVSKSFLQARRAHQLIRACSKLGCSFKIRIVVNVAAIVLEDNKLFRIVPAFIKHSVNQIVFFLYNDAEVNRLQRDFGSQQRFAFLYGDKRLAVGEIRHETHINIFCVWSLAIKIAEASVEGRYRNLTVSETLVDYFREVFVGSDFSIVSHRNSFIEGGSFNSLDKLNQCIGI